MTVGHNDLSDSMPPNSLDASGTSGLVIDNLSVTWLSPAASTQPLGAEPAVLGTNCQEEILL
jgi:hypothetical protein